MMPAVSQLLHLGLTGQVSTSKQTCLNEAVYQVCLLARNTQRPRFHSQIVVTQLLCVGLVYIWFEFKNSEAEPEPAFVAMNLCMIVDAMGVAEPGPLQHAWIE